MSRSSRERLVCGALSGEMFLFEKKPRVDSDSSSSSEFGVDEKMQEKEAVKREKQVKIYHLGTTRVLKKFLSSRKPVLKETSPQKCRQGTVAVERVCVEKWRTRRKMR